MKRIVFLGVLSCFGVGMLAANTAFAADLNSSRTGMYCYKTCLTCYLSYLTPQDFVQSVIVFLKTVKEKTLIKAVLASITERLYDFNILSEKAR